MQMTSVLKRYSQIDERVRYFRVLATASTYMLKDNARTGVVDIADVSGALPTTLAIGTMLKDLGRVIQVYDASVPDESPVGPHVATLREVQIVNGATTGGVSGAAANMFNSYWIATWVSSGSSYPPISLASVARTG